MTLKTWFLQLALLVIFFAGLEFRYDLKPVSGATWEWWVGTCLLSGFVAVVASLCKEKK